MSITDVFQLEVDQNVLVISPARNISSLAEDDVRSQWSSIKTRLSQPDVQHVVFDFEKVDYFGSSMLEAMLSLWKQIDADSGKLLICNVSETAREILRLSRFDTIWPIHASRESALENVAG